MLLLAFLREDCYRHWRPGDDALGHVVTQVSEQTGSATLPDDDVVSAEILCVGDDFTNWRADRGHRGDRTVQCFGGLGGHGMRLYRITAMFLLFPLLPASLYAFGGPHFRTEAGQVSSVAELATTGGLETLLANIHFSYITFLTIGYGNIVAEGHLGHLLVSLEVYASVILGGLLIYVLVKRSEL